MAAGRPLQFGSFCRISWPDRALGRLHRQISQSRTAPKSPTVNWVTKRSKWRIAPAIGTRNRVATQAARIGTSLLSGTSKSSNRVLAMAGSKLFDGPLAFPATRGEKGTPGMVAMWTVQLAGLNGDLRT